MAIEWLRLKREIVERIEGARDTLEQPGSNVDFERGRLAAFRDVLATAEPDKAPLAPVVDYLQESHPSDPT